MNNTGIEPYRSQVGGRQPIVARTQHVAPLRPFNREETLTINDFPFRLSKVNSTTVKISTGIAGSFEVDSDTVTVPSSGLKYIGINIPYDFTPSNGYVYSASQSTPTFGTADSETTLISADGSDLFIAVGKIDDGKLTNFNRSSLALGWRDDGSGLGQIEIRYVY